MKKWLIPTILIIIFFGAIISISNFFNRDSVDEIKKEYMVKVSEELYSDDSVGSDYIKDKLTIVEVSENIDEEDGGISLLGKILGEEITFYDLVLEGELTDTFTKMSDTRKYEVLDDYSDALKHYQLYSDSSGYVSCGESSKCGTETLVFKSGSDTFEIYPHDYVIKRNGEKWNPEQEQRDWELEHTDKIYYRINRFSEDGVFVVKGKYYLVPDLSASKMEMHNFKHRGFDPVLDNKALIVTDSFFDTPPSSKFDIYSVVWEKGSRNKVVRVELEYENISRGW